MSGSKEAFKATCIKEANIYSIVFQFKSRLITLNRKNRRLLIARSLSIKIIQTLIIQLPQINHNTYSTIYTQATSINQQKNNLTNVYIFNKQFNCLIFQKLYKAAQMKAK